MAVAAVIFVSFEFGPSLAGTCPIGLGLKWLEIKAQSARPILKAKETMHIHVWHKRRLPFQPWTTIGLEVQCVRLFDVFSCKSRVETKQERISIKGKHYGPKHI